MVRSALAFCLAGVLAGVLSGGAVQNRGTPDCVTALGARVITLPVRVFDKKYRPIEALRASDFVVRENGARRDVCSLQRQREPVSVGILIDTSRSMRQGGPWLFGFSAVDGTALAAAGIDEFLNQSGPGDEYFFEHVNTGPSMRCSFTGDLARIRAGLHAKPEGLTALVDAVYLALNAMSRARHPNRSLVIVSDGLDNKSVYQWNELERAFTETPIPIFLFLPALREKGSRRVLLNPGSESRDKLLRLVNRGGGFAAVVSDEAEIRSIASQLASGIRTPYLLQYVRPHGPSSAKPARIQVTLRGRLIDSLVLPYVAYYAEGR